MIFSIVRFQLTLLKISSLDRAFQDLSHGILYFSVAKNFDDFVIFTCFRFFVNNLDLRNREIRKTVEKYGNFTEYIVLGTVQNVL